MTQSPHAENAGSRTARALTEQEISAFLKRGFWGVLATTHNEQPYGVPVIYAYDDRGVFYIASGPGKKIEILQRNPNVTLTVVELEDYGRQWRSVIVYGKVEMVEELGQKVHAFNALRKQIPRPAARVRDAAKLAKAMVIRIVPTDITGKAIGY